MHDMEEIPFSGKNLEKMRTDLGLSRKDVHMATGIAESGLYDYEKEKKDPTNHKLKLIGAYFSKVAGRRIRFVSEWDETVIEEYSAFDTSRADKILQNQ